MYAIRSYYDNHRSPGPGGLDDTFIDTEHRLALADNSTELVALINGETKARIRNNFV